MQSETVTALQTLLAPARPNLCMSFDVGEPVVYFTVYDSDYSKLLTDGQLSYAEALTLIPQAERLVLDDDHVGCGTDIGATQFGDAVRAALVEELSRLEAQQRRESQYPTISLGEVAGHVAKGTPVQVVIDGVTWTLQL